MIKLETLGQIRVFAHLDDEELASLQPYLHPLSFARGDYILKENTMGDVIYILTKGKVRVTKDLVKGFNEEIGSNEKVLATLSDEILPTFGENGILGDAPRNANVIAATDCQLYSLHMADFEKYAEAHYRAAYHIVKNIAQVLTERLNTTDENLVKLATALYIAVQR